MHGAVELALGGCINENVYVLPEGCVDDCIYVRHSPRHKPEIELEHRDGLLLTES
jgi:hypothetical protein